MIRQSFAWSQIVWPMPFVYEGSYSYHDKAIISALDILSQIGGHHCAMKEAEMSS